MSNSLATRLKKRDLFWYVLLRNIDGHASAFADVGEPKLADVTHGILFGYSQPHQHGQQYRDDAIGKISPYLPISFLPAVPGKKLEGSV
eukprot:344567-Pyramimonas_sp.AAC.1